LAGGSAEKKLRRKTNKGKKRRRGGGEGEGYLLAVANDVCNVKQASYEVRLCG
jgi:hypothetical protein